MVAVSPKYDSFFVFGFINLLGLINFFEKVPNPRISTLLSNATDSIIVFNMVSIASETCSLVNPGNSFLRDDSMSDLLNVSFFKLFTQF